jgi:hypothetical protein
MDFLNHQIHEGETFVYVDPQPNINAGTVKYGITVATYANTIQAPHLTIEVSTYNGVVEVAIYEVATFTGGTVMTQENRNRNMQGVVTDASTITKGVTSTNGTFMDGFYAGAGTKAAGGGAIRDEWVLKSNTIYRVDVIGTVNPTAAYVKFIYYADKGV